MSKLCPCQLEKLEKKYWEHVSECSLMDCVAEGNVILIQKCICRKKVPKDDPFYYEYASWIERAKRGETITPFEFRPSSTSGSQSPCEHPPESVKGARFPIINPALRPSDFFEPIWCCFKCGLVTCKNPNDTTK